MRPFSPLRRMSQPTKRLRLVGLVVFCGLLLLFFAVYRRYPSVVSCNSPYANVYDVVIDAGSTGSRVHIFQFERAKDGVVLLSERFRRVEPGLSSYALNPDGAQSSLQSLLELAMEAVPRSHYACTSVTLKATAGLRLLPESQQKSVLDVANTTIAQSPFRSRGASIISGAQEGVYGWLTVNYLLGSMNSGDTAVTIDMGGASTQVVFETEKSAGEWLPFNYAHRLRTPRRSIALYQHSYLGLGLNEAKRTMMTAFAAVNGTSSFTCFPTGYKLRHGGVDLHNDGTADFDVCVEMLRTHVVKRPVCKFDACGARGVPQPLLSTGSMPIYAFSYYYDRLHRFQNEGSLVTVSTFKDKGREACRRDSQSHLEAGGETLCMDMAYLYTFLTQALGLTDATPLNVPNRIAGKAVSWSLGSSLSLVLQME
ncbi:ATP diphosphohydrolase [Leptomonas pyrrhocoris]|uniref:ATP diphosphohydrolase n=1 Tax=Leptomonas pyrrhocoris TaxID=157538 RepID=A0A0M9FP73_LEPPY|nr:ATP diphosphohydrolase [Leptomonas pyrrhocoris]KPA73260.1 ATP diphosphohydrolase [Leptomonas pyrrhocoris]|eukprot:XP_015651699.1 ATP diphosphohydrolase [Leptomonas pyrrhocoris]